MNAGSTAGAADGSPGRYRAVLIGFVAVFFTAYACWPQAFAALGVPHYEWWFVDSYAILAANDAVAQGLDPYAINPLDYFGRPHVYSHWWLWLGDVGLTRAANPWLGLAWVGAFFAVALTWLRPRSRREVAAYALMICSGPIVLAVDRANNDLLIFVLLAGVVPGLLSAERAWRWLAVLWIALAAGLKYYPAVAALVLLSGGDRREVRQRIGLMAVALLLVGLSLRHDLANLTATMPQPKGLYRFGAQAIFEPWLASAFAMKVGALLLGAVIFVFGWRSRWLAAWPQPVGREQQREYLGFVLGAALLCGCFWSGMNFGYRWIFALGVAPWIWRSVSDDQAPRAVRRFAGGLAALLLLALWSDALISAALLPRLSTVPFAVVEQWARHAFLAMQPLTWLCFGGLLMLLARFVRQAWERMAQKTEGAS